MTFEFPDTRPTTPRRPKSIAGSPPGTVLYIRGGHTVVVICRTGTRHLRVHHIGYPADSYFGVSSDDVLYEIREVDVPHVAWRLRGKYAQGGGTGPAARVLLKTLDHFLGVERATEVAELARLSAVAEHLANVPWNRGQ